ncbi:MAG: DUF1634 domain-containing protein [Candidatus Omnitrophota bacterium]|jgi:uncharacterized membrane protein
MNKPLKVFTNHEMETIIGNLLRAGVIIAAAVVLLGGMIYLSVHGAKEINYRVFQRSPSYLCNIGGILESAFSFHGKGIIQLGLLLLIATPIARVALSILAFARQRDKLYTIVTTIVFCILMYSLLKR